jgi:acyl carrier protein
MDFEDLKRELKQLVIEECDLELAADELRDDELLLGGDSRLSLDSLDALTIALAVKDRYGKHIDSGNETRNALVSIATLAQFVATD